jgi:hypothetical protein
MDHKIYLTLNLRSSMIQSPIILQIAIIRSGAAALVRSPLESLQATTWAWNELIRTAYTIPCAKEKKKSYISIHNHVGRRVGSKQQAKFIHNLDVTHRSAWNLPILPLGKLRLLAPSLPSLHPHRLHGLDNHVRLQCRCQADVVEWVNPVMAFAGRFPNIQ